VNGRLQMSIHCIAVRNRVLVYPFFHVCSKRTPFIFMNNVNMMMAENCSVQNFFI